MIKLLKYLSPYKGRVAIMLGLMFLQMLGTLYVPTLTADIVNLVSTVTASPALWSGSVGRIWPWPSGRPSQV